VEDIFKKINDFFFQGGGSPYSRTRMFFYMVSIIFKRDF